jgi:hypothetical protein
MASVRDRGTVTTMGRGRLGAARPSRAPLTLADLITAIQDVVGPADSRPPPRAFCSVISAGPENPRLFSWIIIEEKKYEQLKSETV